MSYIPDAGEYRPAAGVKTKEYIDILPFSRLAGRAPQRPKLPTYFIATPKAADK
jgi:hypothetical protein